MDPQAPHSEQAFLLFSVGPVQPFIAAARTLRDLWTGSFLLSWMIRKAMEPILERLGPEAFVFPDMTKDPMGVKNLRAGGLRSPCLPNRFLAEVPAEDAEYLGWKCERAFLAEWRRIGDRVKAALTEEIENKARDFHDEWEESVERFWDAQINSFFDVRWVALPWGPCTPAVIEKVLGPKEGGRKGDSPSAEELWTERVQLAAAVLAAQKAIRKVTVYQPRWSGEGIFPGKCSLLGTYEHLGPAHLERAAEFWDVFSRAISINGTRVRPGERLCAISLVKRFAWAVYLAECLGIDPRKQRFEDTPSVAGADWLANVVVKGEVLSDWARKQFDTWSGHWMYWREPDADPEEDRCPTEVWEIIKDQQKRQGRPTPYYAVLVMDGDHMGAKLRERPGRDHPRGISRALSEFSVNRVPAIVENHLGTLIYSGGDDVLALLPTRHVLKCAREINEAFHQIWREHKIPGSEATMTAGIAVVHYREDLRFGLEEARQANKRAKDAGRNLVGLTICRRSGTHSWVSIPWEFLDVMDEWVEAFSVRNGRPAASDRWAYHLYQELPTLEGLPVEIFRAELKRQVERSEKATKERLSPGAPKKASERVVQQFSRYYELMQSRGEQMRGPGDEEVLRQFVAACQAASFLTRRKEE